MSVNTNNSSQCEAAIAALQQVTDPEIGLNVVDLGLIYGIYFDNDNSNIMVTMTLTAQFCPMSESITDAVTSALANTFKGHQIQLEITFNPPWSSEMISEEGRQFLIK